jgi:DNA-binding MarR family transcriptional regulator
MQCSTCETTFNAYFKDGQHSHTITNTSYKSSIDECRIIEYLKKGEMTLEQLSDALALTPEKVVAILEKLEKSGKIS